MSERAVPDWLTDWVYAHRGLHCEGVPENSFAAAGGAIVNNMGIECDIQLSRDGVPMVFHDWELDRLTDRTGSVSEFTADELETASLLGTDQVIYRFAGLLSFVAGKAPILIEIKSKPGYAVERSCAAVARELKAYPGDHAVMSFDPRVACWFHENSPHTCCGLVMREDEYGYTQTAPERETAFHEARPDFLAYHVAALPSRWVASLREGGLPILTWTVNSPSSRRLALDCADALIAEGAGLA